MANSFVKELKKVINDKIFSLYQRYFKKIF